MLYSSGYANRFGFPTLEVRRRVAERGIASLDTGVAGAIELRLGADGRIRGPWGWRERVRWLWTHRVAD